MKQVSFDAAHIHTSQQADYYLVGFSDRETGFENYVMLQLAYEFDEDDLANGMDAEYFEYNGQGCCGYNCVKEAVLSSQSILFRLQHLKEFEQIRVGLGQVEITPEIIEYLRTVLGGKLTVQDF